MVKYILIIALLLPATALADTLLLGYDSTTAYNHTDCSWIDDSTTINDGKWKANRFQAWTSGTISYFKMRAPNDPGCDDDDGCWAIYEGGTSSSVGTLKAYGCWSGYDWSSTGVGDHTFNVTNTGTDLTVTQGNYYYMVVWSNALDGTYYASGGCTGNQIYAYRGPDADQDCQDVGQVQWLAGSNIGIAEAGYTSIPPPPADTAYDYYAATYRMMGIFAADDTLNISAVSGTFAHGDTITITGTAFGQKNPAAPSIWDDGENATVGSPGYADTIWDETNPFDGASIADTSYIQYWNIPQRGVSGPHSRSNVYIMGVHEDYLDTCVSSPTTRNVNVTHSFSGTTNEFYASWYVRLDPNWAKNAPCTALSPSLPGEFDNYKTWVFQETEEAYTDDHTYSGQISFDGSYSFCDSSKTVTEDRPNRDIFYNGNEYDQSHDGTAWNINDGDAGLDQDSNSCYWGTPCLGRMAHEGAGWVRKEVIMHKDAGFFGERGWSAGNDNDWGMLFENGPGWVFTPDSPAPRFVKSFSVGGYYRWYQCDGGGFRMHDDAARFFDDIYIDDTTARVMLGNASVYEDATIMEPQIPSAWSSTSITIEAHLGALEATTAWLYVFDADNNVSDGYTVVLAQDEEDSSAPSPVGSLTGNGDF